MSTPAATDAADGRPAYQTLRYNEDWSATDARGADLFDPIKHWHATDTVTVSVGGDARLKYELYSEPVFNQKPADDDGFLLQRYLLHADVHATPYVRFFFQLQSSIESFRSGGPRPPDRDDLDVHQAFADFWIPYGTTDGVTVRLGRQEMAYGSQRLISVRESPNNRLAFDAARLLLPVATWQLDAWIAQPVDIDPGVFDDPRQDWTFWGAYGSGPVPLIPGLRADLYYLGSARDDATFARGTADEDRHSFGTRLFGRYDGLDWNFELVAQVGTFGHDDIWAWTAASDTGWTFDAIPAAPRLSLRADIASGDRGGSSLGTFNPLFPRGAYFNEAALIGPMNLMDVQPGVELRLPHDVRLTMSCDVVWRESNDDGVYGTALNLQIAPGSSDASFVGTFPSAALSWLPSRHLTLAMHYVPYLFGAFVTHSLPDQDNGHYVSLIATLRF